MASAGGESKWCPFWIGKRRCLALLTFLFDEMGLFVRATIVRRAQQELKYFQSREKRRWLQHTLSHKRLPILVAWMFFFTVAAASTALTCIPDSPN